MSTNQTAVDHRPPRPAATAHRTRPPSRLPAALPGMGRFRGPFARWPRTADALLAVAALLATVFLEDGPGDTMVIRPIGDLPIPVLAVFVAAGAALYWRRRAPLVVLAVVLTGWAAVLPSEFAHLGFVAIIALYSAGRYAAPARWGAVGAAVATAVIAVSARSDPEPWWVVTSFGGVVMFAAWYIGRRLRSRQQRAAELVREREAEARRVVTEERTRIARELHDVVAHRVSLMTVQAGAAKAVAAQDPAAALQAMGAVEEAGRQALDELRHLLGVLRPEAGDEDDLGPQPGIADLPRLGAQIRRAGVEVTLAVGDLPAELPARLDLFAYRIVQEALTNVLKHAGPGTRADVRAGTDRGSIVVEVVDDGGDAAVATPEAGLGSGGHGIVGMRERALLLGGSLDAGPRAGAGFRVVARLPIGGEPA